MELKSWYSICSPHEDIRKGNLDESTFAVDLWGVVKGHAPQMYLDADEFFKKTYITEGIKTVIKKAASALFDNTESSDRILGLQTSFGGGKTHLLLALYHLAKNKIASELISEITGIPLKKVQTKNINVAVFTNKTCDATQGRKTEDGLHIKTIWGEIAYQLGGKELYSIIEQNDKSRTVPQGLFEDILKKASPCLILIDELADYCVAASGIKIETTTLADQTISFIQQLSGAVAKTPGTMVVATLPASDVEVGAGVLGRSILDALETRYFREAIDIKPVQDQEIYEVIRRRLFDSVGNSKEIKEIVEKYYQMYRKNSSDLPSEAVQPNYKTLLERAYPFHPELIESLYHRWGSHASFQRTRGVLRLLATLVADQWNRKNASTQKCPLIQPCHINWTLDAWNGALTRLWGIDFQPVIPADISSETSNAVLIDKAKDGDYELERITEGIASAILLNSFGLTSQRAGSNTNEIKLACSQPHLNWNLIDGALSDLEVKAFYLHTTSGPEKRFWFNTKPTINKLIYQYTVTFSGKDFNLEIEEHLRSQVGQGIQNLKTLVNPGFDLAEQKSLTFVLLPPSIHWIEDAKNNRAKEVILQISKYCGTRERIYRNTLLFLLVTESGARNLQNAFRNVAVIDAVLKDYSSQLDLEQKTDLKNKLDEAKKSFLDSYSAAYSMLARVEKDTIHSELLSEPRMNIKQYLEAVWKKCIELEWIQIKLGRVRFEESGLIPKEGGIKLKDAADYFLRFTDKPMIPNGQIIINAVSEAVNDGRIGIGLGTSINKLQNKFCKNIPYTFDWSDDAIWIIPPFDIQVEPKPDISVPSDTEATTTPPAQPQSSNIKPTRQIKKIIISGEVPVEEWTQIFRSFIQPTNSMNLRKQKLNIHFEFESGSSSPINPDDSKIKSMKESAKQLGLNFEEDE